VDAARCLADHKRRPEAKTICDSIWKNKNLEPAWAKECDEQVER
jgi:hypothetical protein